MSHERRPVDKNELISGDEQAEILFIHNLIQRNKPIPKRMQRRRLSRVQAEIWHELEMMDALVLQSQTITLATWAIKNRDRLDPKLLQVVLRPGLEAAIDVKDRYMGKPTEKVQIAQAVRVEVHGMDLSRLPDPEKPIEATVLPARPDEDIRRRSNE